MTRAEAARALAEAAREIVTDAPGSNRGTR